MKKLTKGIRRDERPVDQAEGTWRDAKNILVYDQFGSLSSEYGAKDITPSNFPVNKIVIGTIITNTSTIKFFASTNPADSEIGILNPTGTYTRIINDAILNFNINYPIKGTHEVKYNDELIIAWTDNFNPPRILNTSCIPFRVLSNGNVNTADLIKAQNSLQQFPNMRMPLIQGDTDLKVMDGSGALKSGTYYPIVSYELADGTTTFWGKIYNPVPIYVDSTIGPFNKVGGSKGGQSTNKFIDIKFTQVDMNFKYLRVGYIYKENGVVRAYYNARYIIGSPTINVTITGAESTLEEITVDEVLIPNAVYIKAKAITNLQGRLYEANLEEEDDINLQNIANQVKVEWVREKDISLNSRVLSTQSGGVINTYGSYKDPSVVFFNKSFKSGECYAFFLVGKLLNGLYTQAFHIPGRILTNADKASLNGTDPEIDAIAPSGVKKFQIKDTTSSTGEMGAWENENEEYPLDSLGNIHPDYINIPGITLSDRKVRHHVFPDLRTLKSYGENFQKSLGSSTCTLTSRTANTPSGDFGNPDREHITLFYSEDKIFSGTDCFNVSTVDNKTVIDGFAKTGSLSITISFGNIHDLWTCLGMTNNPSSNDCVNHVYADWSLKLNGITVTSYNTEQINGGANVDTFPLSGSASFNLSVTPGDSVIIDYAAFVTTNNNGCGNSFQLGGLVACFISNLTALFTNRVIDSEVLGIKISNLNLSQSIVDKVDSWEIMFAKRDQSNIRIVAQDMIKNGRYHNFDLISTQAISQAKYLKPQLKYTGTLLSGQLQDTINIPNIEAIYNVTEEIKVINTLQYCGENTSIPQNNSNRAQNIFIAAGVGEITSNLIQTQYGNNNVITDICVYKKDIYSPFDIQDLITTGYSFKITTPGVQPVQKIFGGDIHINIFGFRLYLNNTNNYLLSCESASNIGLRFDEPASTKQYYPKFAVATPSYYGYNRDYNCINDLIQVSIHNTNGNCNTDKVTRFSHRVIYSVVDPNESKFLNWRVFKVNDYYEMPKDKGVIWSILGTNRQLYIHHEYSLFLAQIKDSIGSGDSEVFVKTSNVFDRPPQEVLPVTEGYAGNQSHFATIHCKLGYCFIDRNARKVFIYRETLKEISKDGLYNFFKDKGENIMPSVDNPYIGNGYMMAFDEEYNRLIITKKDAQYDFTLSFCQDNWISHHSYKPNVLIYNRSGLFAVNNNTNKIFKHNDKTLIAKYYSGNIEESYIDVVFNPMPQETKVLRSVNWLSDTVKSNNGMLKDATITHLIISNNFQCSGIIDLNQDKKLWFGRDAKNIEDTWNFSDFRDLILDKSSPIFNDKGELILANINNSKPWFEKSLFISKFVMVRFINDNKNQNQVHIIGVNGTFKKSDRL